MNNGILVRVLLLLSAFIVTASGQTVKYSALVTGAKLPYGKNVSITGDLSDLKCGTQKIVDFMNVNGISVTYLGQTSPAATAGINGTAFTIPLGALPADTAVYLQFKITGKMAVAAQAKVIAALINSDQFWRARQAFLELTRGQAQTVVTDEAARFLRSLSDQSGALTQALQSQISCVSITDVTTAAVTAMGKVLPSLANLPQRLSDLIKGHPIDGLTASMTVSEAAAYIAAHVQNGPDYKRGGKPLTGNALTAAKDAVQAFVQDYQIVRDALAVDLVAQVNQAALLDLSSTTTDLEKYAGFDVGAAYVPRINELRQFFMINIYPGGPVELDTKGLISKDWTKRFSIAVGFSLGDLSSNAHSRVKGDSAFMYGVGYRINKYFRLNIGAVIYRDSGAGNALLNEFSIGPSIDLTALPGLKSLFASASGGGNSTSASGTGNSAGTSGTGSSKNGSGTGGSK
jgi:hypothetical protein